MTNEQKQVIENVTVKPNSFTFRWGGTGTDAKIYFDNEAELKAGIDMVISGRDYLATKLNNGGAQ